MFHIDKTLLNPNIPVTIRFTQQLIDWLPGGQRTGKYFIQSGRASMLQERNGERPCRKE